jgi:hypothetical protein
MTRLCATLFSSTNPDSVRRNIQWSAESFDPALVAQVQAILKPVFNKQWDY